MKLWTKIWISVRFLLFRCWKIFNTIPRQQFMCSLYFIFGVVDYLLALSSLYLQFATQPNDNLTFMSNLNIKIMYSYYGHPQGSRGEGGTIASS